MGRVGSKVVSKRMTMQLHCRIQVVALLLRTCKACGRILQVLVQHLVSDLVLLTILEILFLRSFVSSAFFALVWIDIERRHSLRRGSLCSGDVFVGLTGHRGGSAFLLVQLVEIDQVCDLRLVRIRSDLAAYLRSHAVVQLVELTRA